MLIKFAIVFILFVISVISEHVVLSSIFNKTLEVMSENDKKVESL